MVGGSKKKKKPAANPARGFATTSVASKVKTERSAEASNTASEDVSTVATSTPDQVGEAPVEALDIPSQSRELHELSPEELEAQLEQSDLQQAVEQHGAKARKEASRQISRLETDRRVLRTQSDHLLVREWLPDELMQQIVELTLDESSSTSSDGRIESSRESSEDVVLLRIWQLYLVLGAMDLSEERVSKALQYILSCPPSAEPTSAVWGLNELLEWLTLNCEPGELREYDASKPKAQAAIMPEPEPAVDNKDGHNSWKKKPTQVNGSQSAEKQEDTEPAPQDDVEVSDMDSDMEPDEMILAYLTTKAKLYDRNPDLVEGPGSGKRSTKQKGSAGNSASRSTPGEAKLQQRLKKIESDVLFDQQMADYQWGEQKVDIIRQRAERLRLDVDAKHTVPEPHRNDKPSKVTSKSIMDEAEELGRKLLEEASLEDDAVLGGMFDAPAVSESSISRTNGSGDTTRINNRNFGKISGMSPRRIFEDACRSRDSGVRIHFKMISPTTYSCRHAVTVTWSKDQDIVEGADDYMEGFKALSGERFTSIEMQTVAAPEVAQSEGYIATAALYLIFSSSPKEEKAALRLPPVFRDLWQEFVSARRDYNDSTDRMIVQTLRQMIKEQKEKDDDEDVILTAGLKSRSKAASGVSTPNEQSKATVVNNGGESDELKGLWAAKSSTPSYQQMLVGRKELPMYQFRDVALEAVRRNQVTIVCGETGCGKSTQMPSFILEDELSHGRNCKVYCTEPRRISAISLAQRVSEELGEGKNAVGTARSLVGYAIRLESQTVASTRLVYATVGIVLRMLETEKGIKDITHLVIDEIHERSIDTDFLLIILRSLLVRRPDLKVVLMSATVDAQRFSTYLGNAPIVNVPGRTFPVKAMFLEDAIEVTGHVIEDGSHPSQSIDEDREDMESGPNSTTGEGQQLSGYSPKTIKTLSKYDEYMIDYSLIVKLLETVAYSTNFQKFSNAVLVFLPGIAEIRQLNDMLTSHLSFAQGWLVYPLHSSFSSEEQQAAFKVPPRGMRKIVLATNIAETGITIPDVTCVVDTGKHKEMRFDERRQMSRLIQAFISRANAKQRRGRAGRVQEGICFHLFTKNRHDNIMAEQQTPEMLRLSLQDLVMRVKICKLGDIEHALSAALDPPSLKNIRRAIDALVEVDALTPSEELTPLGQQLAKLPLDAQLGKLILLGSTFGCLDFALTTAAISSSKSPFLAPMHQKKQADTVRLGYKRGDSDPLTAYNAYTAWRKVCTTPGSSEFQFCKKNFLSQQNLVNIEELKSQLLSSLADAGFVSLSSEDRSALSRVRQGSRHRTFVPVPATKNTADMNDLLINSVTAWSFYPKILQREGKGWRNIGNNQAISLHPTSVNKLSSTPTFDATRYLSFYSIMQSSSRFTNAQETSPAEAMVMVLLAGDAVFNLYAGVIIIDGNRLRFKVRDWRTMVVLKTLRTKMRDILARSFKSPGRELSQKQKMWFEIFVSMFDRVNTGKVDRR